MKTNERESNNPRFQGQPRTLNDNINNSQQRTARSNESSLIRQESAPIASLNERPLPHVGNVGYSEDDSSYFAEKNYSYDESFQRALQESLLEQNLGPKEVSLEDALEISRKEAEINQQIHDEIFNQKGLLKSILLRLSGVDPSDPIFSEFFTENGQS